jgi:hypothetical protein
MARELDKWQQREAQQYAADNSVSYGAAVKVLFPEDEQEPAAPAEDEQAPADDSKAKTGAKVSVSK